MLKKSSGPIQLDINKIVAQLNLNPEGLKDVLRPNLCPDGSSTQSVCVKST